MRWTEEKEEGLITMGIGYVKSKRPVDTPVKNFNITSF